jgi:general secretion pathway protein A
MYTDFYKLKRNPFEITPDPYFLFSTKKHKESLAALYYGVRQQKGFVVLTGEAGTGKTLLIRCLLQICKGEDIATAYIFNSRLSALEFLHYVTSDLGLAASDKTKGDTLQELNRFLLDRHRRKLTTVLIVDEAHLLPTEILEEIRLLTNLETAEQKLLQIVLAGQSELSDKLDSHELRQLKQRIALRAYLEPLDLETTHGYIRRRLQLAGAPADSTSELLPGDTIARIHQFSRGIPRLINTISDNALLTAFARQLKRIPPDIIDEVATELRLNVARPQSFSIFESSSSAQETLTLGQSLLRLRHPVQRNDF